MTFQLWTADETDHLLSIWEKEEVLLRLSLDNYEQGSLAYRKIGELMLAGGFSKNATQCRMKMRRMKFLYEKAKSSSQTLQHFALETMCPKYYKLEEILTKGESIEKTAVLPVPENTSTMPADESIESGISNDSSGIQLWSREETHRLLSIWCSNEVATIIALQGYGPTSKAYKKMAELMESSGLHKNAHQCHLKTKKMRYLYEKAKEKLRIHGNRDQAKKKCRYFSQLERIIARSPGMRPRRNLPRAPPKVRIPYKSAYFHKPERDGKKKSRMIWTKEETKAFIDIWAEEKYMKKLRRTRKRKTLEMMAMRLKRLGYPRCGAQCESKLKALRHSYRVALEKLGSEPPSNRCQREVAKICPFFDEIDQIVKRMRNLPEDDDHDRAGDVEEEALNAMALAPDEEDEEDDVDYIQVNKSHTASGSFPAVDSTPEPSVSSNDPNTMADSVVSNLLQELCEGPAAPDGEKQHSEEEMDMEDDDPSDGTKWKEKELRAFIFIWSHRDICKALAAPNAAAAGCFDSISKRLEAMGYRRDAGQCSDKLQMLKNLHAEATRKVNEEHMTVKAAARICPHYGVVDMIIKASERDDREDVQHADTEAVGALLKDLVETQRVELKRQEEMEDDDEKPARQIWSHEEVGVLISLWSAKDICIPIASGVRNEVYFDRLATRMQAVGYIRDAAQCRTKVKALRMMHKKAKQRVEEEHITMREADKICPYYGIVDMLTNAIHANTGDKHSYAKAEAMARDLLEEKPGRTRWREDELRAFIYVWSHRNICKALADPNVANTGCFDNISRRLEAMGHKRDASHCRAKFQSLKKLHAEAERRVKEENITLKAAGRICPHYNVVDMIIKASEDERDIGSYGDTEAIGALLQDVVDAQRGEMRRQEQMGRSEYELNNERTARQIWTHEEVGVLISIWSAKNICIPIATSVRNEVYFDRIAKRMQALGLQRDAAQCRTKVKAIRMMHKKAKQRLEEEHITMQEAEKICPYYSIVDMLTNAINASTSDEQLHASAEAMARDLLEEVDLYTGGPDEEGPKKSHLSRSIWTEREVRALISIWSSRDICKKVGGFRRKNVGGTTRNAETYERIAMQLEAVENIQWDAVQCRTKIKALKGLHRQAKQDIEEKNITVQEAESICPHYSVVDMIITACTEDTEELYVKAEAMGRTLLQEVDLPHWDEGISYQLDQEFY